MKKYEAATIVDLGSAEELVLGDVGSGFDGATEPPNELPAATVIDNDD